MHQCPHRLRAATAAVLAAACAACTTTAGNGRLAGLDEPAATALLVPGRTSEAQVRDALGQGSVIRFESGYETWHYYWREGLPKGWDDVPFIGLVTARSHHPTKELVILFDPSGVVRRWSLQAGGTATS
jgi:hypothetical protein